jgi:hypothetical protein
MKPPRLRFWAGLAEMATDNDRRGREAAHRAATPPSGRHTLTRRRGIGGHPATDPRSGQRRRVVAVRGADRGRRWGARGVTRFAGSPTPGQSAPQGAAGHPARTRQDLALTHPFVTLPCSRQKHAFFHDRTVVGDEGAPARANRFPSVLNRYTGRSPTS